MDIRLIIPSLLFGYGIYLIIAYFLKIPSTRLTKVMTGFGKKSKGLMDIKEDITLNLAVKIEKIIKLDTEKEKKFNKMLEIAHINKTAKSFISYNISSAIVVFCLYLSIIILLNNIQLVVIIATMMSIKTYFNETNKLKLKIKLNKENIEKNMYSFVSTLEQETKNHRDIVKMLENYKKNTSEIFKRELEVLIVDMKLTNYEMALLRFEARINSTMVSEVVRGILATIQGDDTTAYFKMLSFRFKEFELNRLEKEAQKIPPKVTKFSMIAMLSMVAIFGTMIYAMIVENADAFM